MSEAQRARLFKRFSSGRAGGGKGLGLYLAWQIVETHGGRIAYRGFFTHSCGVLTTFTEVYAGRRILVPASQPSPYGRSHSPLSFGVSFSSRAVSFSCTRGA